MSRRWSLVACALAASTATVAAHAGGVIEGVRFTSEPSSIDGQVIVHTVPSRWDDRCIPVFWRVNDTRDPIRNSEVAPVVSLADAIRALQRALDTWNAVPTSYITMQIVGTVSNPGPAGFDLVNEITFVDDRGGTRAQLTRLVEDSVLEDGDDLNGDGIPDVSAAITTCQLVAGRTKFPAGSYKAGTILDADVLFETIHDSPLAVSDADLTNPDAFDLQSLATHEFGHALGLTHSLHTQRGTRNGRGAVMGAQYSFDPVDKLSLRTLDSDDAAWVSYLYPEGTAASGPAALQPGDVAFDRRYGLVAGTLHHGRQDVAVPGGAVFAQDMHRQELVASGYSGTVRLSGDPDTGEVIFLPPEKGIVDGRFVIPVPAGTYSLYVKPVGLPLAADIITTTALAGEVYGLLDFHEEWVDRRDDAVERRPDRASPFRVHAGRTLDGIDIVTNRTIDVNGFGPHDFTSLAAVEDPAGNIPIPYFAVRIPRDRYAEVTRSAAVPILSALFFTVPFDPSAVQRFPEALLTTGTVNVDGTASLDLAKPLARVRHIVGRDFELTPAFFDDPKELGRRVSRGMARGEIGDLFVALAIPPPPYPGPSGQPPLLGFSCHEGRDTLSYFTLDGVTFQPLFFCEVLFSLIVAEPPASHSGGAGLGEP
jgi:hypothetical protein